MAVEGRGTPLWGGKPPGDVHGPRPSTHLCEMGEGRRMEEGRGDKAEGWREIIYHTRMQWFKFYTL